MALAADKCYLSSFNFAPFGSFLHPFIYITLFLVPCPYHSALGCRRRGAAGRLRRWGREGGHHARDRARSRRLPPQRPARVLPRPGPHAPISEELLGGVGERSAKRREEALKADFAVVTEADGGRKGRVNVPLLWSGLRAAPVEVGRIWSEGHRCSLAKA